MNLNVAAACGGRAESVPKRASFDLTNGLEFCIKKRAFRGKCPGTVAEELKKIMPRAKWCDTLICVPACNIQTAAKAFKDLRISVGAENVYFEEKGAYTGEISADMLKDLGVKYVIVGHSETDTTVNKKVHAVLNAGMNPIICVGESLDQRETGITDEWIALQVKSALYGVPADKLRRCIIAYEPIWAIGTGKTATAEQAGEVCTNLSLINI